MLWDDPLGPDFILQKGRVMSVNNKALASICKKIKFTELQPTQFVQVSVISSLVTSSMTSDSHSRIASRSVYPVGSGMLTILFSKQVGK
jgi:uncharacterized protein YegL